MDATGLTTHEEIVDWFDAVLDESWTREFDRGEYGYCDWFTLGSIHNPTARIVIDDGQIKIHEFDERGWNVATTTLSGDAQRQCPRALTILGID